MAAARKANGQFEKGVSGNPKGRPKKAREERYYEITMTACTYADWKLIVRKAVSDAKRGDASARKWLSDYLVGAPEHNVNLRGLLDLVIDWDAANDND